MFKVSHHLAVTEDTVRKRLQRVREICQSQIYNVTWQRQQTTGNVWISRKHDLHYCISPKIGCTYWKQFMRFIADDYPKGTQANISKPHDIDRYYTHYHKVSKLIESRLPNPMTMGEMSKGRSFTFTRNPYTRLWSAYIDKFFLPDFWLNVAPAIMGQTRRNATYFEKRQCGRGVTFEEFLRHIVQQFPKKLNEHWEPIHKLCGVCYIDYDVIGKIETFEDDSHLILHKFGFTYLNPNKTSKLVRAVEELTMLVKYNFDLAGPRTIGCFNTEDVATLLWKAFQYNGYIHDSISLPMNLTKSEQFKTHPKQVFMKHVIDTLKHQVDHNMDLKFQKINLMKEAYGRIPKKILDGIKEVYRYDFEMFGYDNDVFKL